MKNFGISQVGIQKYRLGTSKNGIVRPPTYEEQQQQQGSLFNRYFYKQRQLDNEYDQRSEKEKIPFIKDKQIQLTNAGKLTGAKLSTNMLDSIAKYGAITGVPIQTAIGLAGQESTFGTNRSEMEPHDINPRYLVNDHDYTPSAYRDLYMTAYNKAAKLGLPRRFEELVRDSIIKSGERYTEKQLLKQREERDIPVLQHAFRLYLSGKYNSGDPNHTKDVENTGKAAFNSPEIQKWWNNEGYKWYE